MYNTNLSSTRKFSKDFCSRSAKLGWFDGDADLDGNFKTPSSLRAWQRYRK
jgi:hypothetical protein